MVSKESSKSDESYTYRNRHVDTKLTCLNVALEATSSGARVGKYGSSVAILVGVDQVDGIFEGWYIDTNQDGAKDLFGVALHVWLYVGDESWADL